MKRNPASGAKSDWNFCEGGKCWCKFWVPPKNSAKSYQKGSFRPEFSRWEGEKWIRRGALPSFYRRPRTRLTTRARFLRTRQNACAPAAHAWNGARTPEIVHARPCSGARACAPDFRRARLISGVRAPFQACAPDFRRARLKNWKRKRFNLKRFTLIFKVDRFFNANENGSL